MGKKRLHPQGDPNKNRSNGKAWKRRPCGNRHAAYDPSCRPCAQRTK